MHPANQLHLDRTASRSQGQNSTLQRVYAAYAETYDTRWARYSRDTHHAAFAELRGLVRPDDGVVVDVACGTGLLALGIAERWPELRILGFDLSEPMLARARERLAFHSRFQASVASADRLPLADTSADLVTCTNAFHLISDQNAALREFHRVLRPGGRLLIIDWCRDTLWMKVMIGSLRMGTGPHRRVTTSTEILKALARENLEFRTLRTCRSGILWDLFSVTAVRPARRPEPPARYRPRIAANQLSLAACRTGTQAPYTHRESLESLTDGRAHGTFENLHPRTGGYADHRAL